MMPTLIKDKKESNLKEDFQRFINRNPKRIKYAVNEYYPTPCGIGAYDQPKKVKTLCGG